jgi:hypothetical protein
MLLELAFSQKLALAAFALEKVPCMLLLVQSQCVSLTECGAALIAGKRRRLVMYSLVIQEMVVMFKSFAAQALCALVFCLLIVRP